MEGLTSMRAGPTCCPLRSPVPIGTLKRKGRSYCLCLGTLSFSCLWSSMTAVMDGHCVEDSGGATITGGGAAKKEGKALLWHVQ